MPTNQETENFYQQNKEGCKRLIDDILGEDFGTSQRERRAHELPNQQALIRSSKKALKSVFEDPELGKKAFDYLSDLKIQDGKTPEQQESDSREFQKRASEVKSLLGSNKRKIRPADAFRPRVVGDAVAKQNQLSFAGATVLGLTGLGLSGGLALPAIVAAFVGDAALLLNVAAFSVGLAPAGVLASRATERTLDAVGNRRLNSRRLNSKTVTKINGDKKVKSNSSGFEPELQPELQMYEQLDLKYKDLLYQRMTGEQSPKYHAARTHLETLADIVFENMNNQVRYELNQSDAADMAIKKYSISNNSRTKESSDISRIIQSYLFGDDPPKSEPDNTFRTRVQSSRSSERAGHL